MPEDPIEAARRRIAELEELTAREKKALEALLLASMAKLDEEIAKLHGGSDLHTTHKGASNKHMPAAAVKHIETSKRIGPPFKSDHPLAAWIEANGTAEALAAKLAKKAKEPCSASRVRSWYLPSPHGRPCPETFQAILEEPPYSIPRSAWKNRPSR